MVSTLACYHIDSSHAERWSHSIGLSRLLPLYKSLMNAFCFINNFDYFFFHLHWITNFSLTQTMLQVTYKGYLSIIIVSWGYFLPGLWHWGVHDRETFLAAQRLDLSWCFVLACKSRWWPLGSVWDSFAAEKYHSLRFFSRCRWRWCLRDCHTAIVYVYCPLVGSNRVLHQSGPQTRGFYVRSTN